MVQNVMDLYEAVVQGAKEILAMAYSFPLWWVALSVFVAVLLARLILKYWGTASGKDESIPLPRGSYGLPFIGETLSFFRGVNSSNPCRFVLEREPKYGSVFRSNLFGYGRRTVVSADPDFSKYVLQNEGRLFLANYMPATKNLLGKYGMVTVQGDLQRKLHATAVHLLRPEKLISDFMEDIQNSISNIMKKWQHNDIIQLQHECNKIVLNLMGKKLLDLPPAEEMQELYDAFQVFQKAHVCFPINYPGSAYSKGMKARETIIKHIYKCIEDRRSNPDVVHNDLLSKLLKEESFTDEIIGDFLVFMLFAGHETSSSVMGFAIRFLTTNPEALEKIRAEHDSLLKAKGGQKLTWEDYESMKFTHCVIKESLRVANVAPGVPRQTMKDIKYKDFMIPKGWTIFVLLNGMHLNDKHYPDPLKFDPWRWQDEGLDMGDKASFMPFGKGGRLCPGYHLARFEIALFLHAFLTKFTWEETEEDHLNNFPLPYLVKGYPIRISSRQ